MYPTLANGDYVVISTLFWRLKADDIVVVEHPEYQKIIKRIDTIDDQGHLWLKGDNEASLSPEKMGWIKKQWLVGKVIYTIKPRSRSQSKHCKPS